MIEAIINLGLGVTAIVLIVIWIFGLVNSDGHCHAEDCSRCPYEDDCPERRKRDT